MFSLCFIAVFMFCSIPAVFRIPVVISILALVFSISVIFGLEITKSRSSCPDVFCKKVFLKLPQNSQKNTCARASF